jgi:alkyl sulfatase BDS1-like metallo-beta-lactamase superfamily hydrolase
MSQRLMLILLSIGWLMYGANGGEPTATVSSPEAAPQSAAPQAPIPQPASAATRAANQAVFERLPFDDRRDFEDARRGFLAPLPNEGVVKDADGKVIFDARAFAFPLDAPPPDTVNPSLWRQSQLNGISGLFKVVERIYQVRGLDISVITFIEGSAGVIVLDPCVSVESARTALELYFAHRPKKPVTAVIYSHSHVDHFGGVRGVVTQAEVDAGSTRIIAPAGFTEEAISENVLAGNVMTRRASYMFGNLLPRGGQGTVGSGLGATASEGTVSLLLPTELVSQSREDLTIDGLKFEFLLTPGSEAPSEMHFYLPELRALCTAENAVHTQHNFYTLRGAKTRDIHKWVHYLDETLELWGDKAEVLFAPHHWPVWGNAALVDHIEKYRDTLQYLHDQALRLANQGYTMVEVAEQIELPESLARNWSSRGYYGTVNHNAKAVYNFYLGYFSGNPAELHPLPPVDAARRYVEFMGGADAVVEKARLSFAAGEYRWVAQVVNHVVQAEPEHQAARHLLADALEQLGYQAESGPWRNFYLSGALELRAGVRKQDLPRRGSADILRNMPRDQFFDYLAVRLNGPRAADKQLSLVFRFTDLDEQHTVTVKNAVLHHRPQATESPDVELALAWVDLNDVALGKSTFPQMMLQGKLKVTGDAKKLTEFFGLLDQFEFSFNIVTPNAPRPAPTTRAK